MISLHHDGERKFESRTEVLTPLGLPFIKWWIFPFFVEPCNWFILSQVQYLILPPRLKLRPYACFRRWTNKSVELFFSVDLQLTQPRHLSEINERFKQSSYSQSFTGKGLKLSVSFFPTGFHTRTSRSILWNVSGSGYSYTEWRLSRDLKEQSSMPLLSSSKLSTSRSRPEDLTASEIESNCFFRNKGDWFLHPDRVPEHLCF